MKRLLGIAAFLLAAACAHGQAAPANVVKMEVSPAQMPLAALRYRLLPPLRDQSSGNAVFYYQRAHNPEFFSGMQRHADFNHFHDWLTLPLDKLPVEKIRAFLSRPVLNEIDTGARRLNCDWELAERVRKHGVSTLIPEAQVSRTFAALIALRARLEIHDKKYDKAIYSLQSGYALARHIAEGPTLINALVGLAITGVMNKQLETLMQQPDAPNFYWSLTYLPRPFIDMRTGLEGEGLFMDAMFPNVRDQLFTPPGKIMPLTDIQAALGEVALAIGESADNKAGAQLLFAVYAAKVYPEAKKFFLQNGWTEAQISALPVTQLAIMHSVADYDRHLDDMVKAAGLPYWQARPLLEAANQRLREAKATGAVSPGLLAQLLLPAVQAAVLAHVRVDRQFAVLRCVEALRLYAAAHDGALPATLDDIKEVPIPVDPLTGKAFTYRVVGRTVHISGGPPEGETASERNSVHYEITMRGEVQKKSDN